MKKFLIRSLVVCGFVFAASFAANAQNNAGSNASADSAGVAVLKGTGRAAVIVVGSAGKIAWGTTKFVARSVAKPILLTAAPAAGKFALKKSAKYILPLAVKLSLL